MRAMNCQKAMKVPAMKKRAAIKNPPVIKTMKKPMPPTKKKPKKAKVRQVLHLRQDTTEAISVKTREKTSEVQGGFIAASNGRSAAAESAR